MPALSLDEFRPLIGDERYTRLEASARLSRSLLADNIVWNLNSTASGGGVAEMLHVLVGYIRGFGNRFSLDRDRRYPRILRHHQEDSQPHPWYAGRLGNARPR